MQNAPLPKAFEPDYYRAQNPDLTRFSDEEAFEHYKSAGIGKGFQGSPCVLRSNLVGLLKDESSILEIGPFQSPSVRGENVRYLDAFSTEELIEAAAKHGLDPSNIPHIDYVAPKGGFDMVDRNFSAIFSSHCIEHQPDLIRHLQGVSEILNEGGRYYIICPDKRYCFDHYVPETTLVDVLAAFQLKCKVHQPRSFIAPLLYYTHNDAVQHWERQNGPKRHTTQTNLRADLLDNIPSDDAYHDVHAWQFTPASFYEIVSFLNEIGLVKLEVERVYHTAYGLNEFVAVLKNGAVKDRASDIFVEESTYQSHAPASTETISDYERKILNLNERCAVLEQELSNIYASRSWTITKPLRKLVGALRH